MELKHVEEGKEETIVIHHPRTCRTSRHVFCMHYFIDSPKNPTE